MIDFEIHRCTRRCAKTERELRPDEEFYSVLVADGAADGGQVARRDFSTEGWEGPPPGAIGWWKSKMPPAEPTRKSWAPSDVMLECFQRIAEQPDQEEFRYVLALLMTRRRILRHEATERDEASCEWSVLYCPRNEQEYKVKVAIPDEGRAKQIQDELAKLFQ